MPIWEAIERWTPKEIWQRYREISEAEIPLRSLSNPNPLNMEARRLRWEIEGILTAKLRNGELIASGLASPLRPDTRRCDISPELWSRLKLNIRTQEASGDGLKFVTLHFREPGPASTAPSPASKESEPEQRRSAGRPSLMREIEAEMRRRTTSEELAESLAAEAEALVTWAQRQFPNVHVPKPGTINRKLGRVYRELKTTKSPDK